MGTLFGSRLVSACEVTLCLCFAFRMASSKQELKWALEKFRDGAVKSQNAQVLFDRFHALYIASDIAGMEQFIDRYGIAKGVRVLKHDWDSMSLGVWLH